MALALAMVMAFAVLPGGVFRLFADTVSLEKLSEAPGDGDRVVIYHATGGVLGTAASGSKLAAVAAAPDEDGKITSQKAWLFLQ